MVHRPCNRPELVADPRRAYPAPVDTPLAKSRNSAKGTSPSAVPLERILDRVRSYWGFDTLRPLQEEAIRATLDGRDSVVVLPTGGGKSLCYQVPPVVADSTDIVVSPLISLMKDQVDGLRACGYPAAALHSGLCDEERDETNRALHAGSLRLLFVSPERLLTPRFLDLVEQMNVKSFAIDEAHCISHWGHDFRPEYRKLALLKKRFPHASVHAYTATATHRVREDIAKELHLTNPAMLEGRFDRPNLTYRVVPRVDVHSQAVKVARRHKQEGMIVYCLSRKDTEQMAAALRTAGIDARAYHAGLSADERRRTQDAFTGESLNVVAATVAFGMGIDRSNVRCVVHACMPKSIEHYQQETGRAGRDGLEAECVLFYSAGDVMRWQSLIARSAEDSADPDEFVAVQNSLVEQMRRYATAIRCRHRALTVHFGQSYPESDCQACDICLNEAEGLEDATEVAQKILANIARVQQLSGMSYGVMYMVDVLMGANTDLVRQRGHDRVSTYGILRDTPKKILTNWVYQLLDQDLVNRTPGDRPVLQLNDASWEVMRGTRKVRLTRPAEKAVRVTRASVASWEGVDRELFEHLRGIRRELASQAGAPPWTVFTDRTLRDLARRRPTTRAEFRQTPGIGDAKLKKFGVRFTKEITAYCREHGLATDVDENTKTFDPGDDASFPKSTVVTGRTVRVSRTKQAAFDMFAKGASIDDAMSALARVRSTTNGYLVDFIACTKPTTIDQWLDRATYDAVAAAAGEVGTARLNRIFERLDARVAYDEIKLVTAHLESRSK